ncbi:hypothetical protein Droror1_Dr00021426 [Drosera rotundifolia]
MAAADLFGVNGGGDDESTPLWFKPASFLSPTFSAPTYIADLRTFVPLETLRSHLRSHLSNLQRDLIDLINRDYNEFVNLTTNLVDVEGVVVRMRAPVVELRGKVEEMRRGLERELVKVRDGLTEREEAARAREVVELLLDTFHVVSKVEKLIQELPSVPKDLPNGDSSATDQSHLSNGISQHGESGSNTRETQSMLLERIASEMNRLKFYMAHAKDLPFVQNMEKRIHSASLMLDSSLGHCFVDGLQHRDETVIYNCLRAYAALDNTSSAEEIFRTTIVAPLVGKVVKHSLSELVAETSGNELQQDYQLIEHYVENNFKFLLEISSRENSGLHVFNFLANSILKEVLLAVQKEKPGAFSPGRPTEFLRNYKSSLDFLAFLEGYCPSRLAVSKFRSEPVYSEFMRQWNIGVYFSLRFQEIAGSLDSALASPTLVVLPSETAEKQGLTLKQSFVLLESLKSCWSEDVLLLSSSDKFLRLSLQLLSRYSKWLSSGLGARKSSDAGAHPGSEWALSAVTEDFMYILHDIDFLESKISGDYLQLVLQLLASCPADVQDLVKQSILQSRTSLKDLATPVMKSIIEALVEKSVEDLRQLKGITATYRMTNKPLPVRHSPYVSGILRPLKAFLEGDRAITYLTKDMISDLLEGTAFEITNHYYALAEELVTMARKTESSLRKMRQGAQKRTGTSSDVADQSISNTDKICMQLFLDIQEYGRNLASLGVDVAKIPAYQSLWQCVAPADKQNTISF